MKMSKKILFTSIGVLLVALGAIALITPKTAAALLVYLVGFAILLSGVATAVTAFLPNFVKRRKSLVALAALNLVVGVLIMLISEYYILLVGVGLTLSGLTLIVVSLQLKRQHLSWLSSTSAAVVAVVLGIVCMLFFEQIQEIIGILLGVVLLAAGIILIIFGMSRQEEAVPYLSSDSWPNQTTA